MSVKVAIAQINSTVGDLIGNCRKIVEFSKRATKQGADIVLTPELVLVGYPPEDLLLRQTFYLKAHAALHALTAELAVLRDVYVIVGHPMFDNGMCFNSASVLFNGRIISTYNKLELPNNGVFDEKRYFSSSAQALVFDVKNVRFGINICEDSWFAHAPLLAKRAGAQVLLILNGSPYHINKQTLRYDILRANVTKQGMSLVFANLVGGQDELVFDGNSFVLDIDGKIVLSLAHAKEDLQLITFHGPKASYIKPILAPILSVEAQVYQALVLGVRDYINKNNFTSVLLGLSGGIDSALTLAIAVDALGSDKVHAIMMPSPYTADISVIDSRKIVKHLGVHYEEIPIDMCFSAFRSTLLEKLNNFKQNKVEENIQARIRGTLLMALSNKYGSIVLTTSNKSEIAIGYCTLYGDMAGGFAVIKDISKTFVYRLCNYRNNISSVIPNRVLTRAPSAELFLNQTDQDFLPPYDVLDSILELYVEKNYDIDMIEAVGYSKNDIACILNLVKLNEYKRRQAPIGIRITHRAFGRDWRYPVTSRF